MSLKSFRTEYEEQIAENKLFIQQDIIELGEKIARHKAGTISDDSFRSFRLARGVYGQRQLGVQMIRIKLPYGKVTTKQLRRIAQVSDDYSTGKLHITTRQDIQIHHVSLDRTPELWEELERDDVTLREACGNTVRNVTASDTAGIDPSELFDVTPYADAVFRYFLRKPFGQELGRKIKIAFSATDKDEAYVFMHDFGFIPRIQIKNGAEHHGFKVVVGGGLGAQPLLAQIAHEFLDVTQLIPFIEAAIRVFDRYGERNNRNKARLKYLIAKLGLEQFLALVTQETNAVQFDSSADKLTTPDKEKEKSNQVLVGEFDFSTAAPDFHFWFKHAVFQQKQAGLFTAYLQISLGDFSSDQARTIALLLEQFNLDEIRFTIDQNIQIRHIPGNQLVLFYQQLKSLDLHKPGVNSTADITACPGTDTCNLAISNSTQVALALEEHVRHHYPALLEETQLKIKISGCMNSCGQHALAQIGFHGSSIKTKDGVLPALQVLLGGGSLGGGFGRIAEKVIKIPSKRVLKAVTVLIDDFLEHREEEETFNLFVDRCTISHFYQLLKPLADLSEISTTEYQDWGKSEAFATAIGVGECAGVLIDLASTLLADADEKMEFSAQSFQSGRYADSLYFSYSAAILVAKSLLIQQNVRCNTQHGILSDFDNTLGPKFGFMNENSFSKTVLAINQEKATKAFANQYSQTIRSFIQQVKTDQ